jgi:hypothetical protein
MGSFGKRKICLDKNFINGWQWPGFDIKLDALFSKKLCLARYLEKK